MNTKQNNQQLVQDLMAYLEKQGTLPDQVKSGAQVAYVTAGAELVKEEKDRLSAALSKIMGHTVTINVTVDPSLIAGFRIEAGDWVIETSVKSQLEKMAQKLKE